MSKQQHRGEYPPDWKEISKRVKDESGNRCIRCGHPAGDKIIRNQIPVEQAGPLWEPVYIEPVPCDEHCHHPYDPWKPRVLTVHHLDCDKGNVEWWNLAALCQVCHLVIQGKVIMERPWMFEHTEWMKPYAAGYYAHRAGLPTDRPYVMAHLDELLALGRPVVA